MNEKNIAATGKAVLPGKVVRVKLEFTNKTLLRMDEEFRNSMSREKSYELDTLFTVLSNPKMIVKNGHEILVVDCLDSSGAILIGVPLHFLESVV
jgi:hypothetical protein